MAIIPHPRDIQTAVVDWLDDRFPFTKTVDEALYQRVPNYANAFYYCFGGMVFILIVFMLLTGVFLSFYYVPDAGTPGNSPAYNSVLFIQNTQYLGWALLNRDALLPSAEQIARAREIAAEARERLAGRMELLFVLPDLHRGGEPRQEQGSEQDRPRRVAPHDTRRRAATNPSSGAGSHHPNISLTGR